MYQKRKFPYAVFSVLLLLFLSAGYLASGLLVLPEEVAAFSEESLSYLFANIFSLCAIGWDTLLFPPWVWACKLFPRPVSYPGHLLE